MKETKMHGQEFYIQNKILFKKKSQDWNYVSYENMRCRQHVFKSKFSLNTSHSIHVFLYKFFAFVNVGHSKHTFAKLF